MMACRRTEDNTNHSDHVTESHLLRESKCDKCVWAFCFVTKVDQLSAREERNSKTKSPGILRDSIRNFVL